MDYINNGSVTSLAQGLLKRPLHQTKCQNNNYRYKGQSIHRHNIVSDHHLWEPNTNIALFALSHQYEWNLTLSNSWKIYEDQHLQLLSKTHNNQMSWRKDLRFFEWPVQWINWMRCLLILRGSTPATPIQDLICCNNELKTSQWRNKWDVFSSWSHSATHLTASCWIMLRLTRLFLVGNLSRNNLQAKIDTLRGTYLCQTKSPITSGEWATWLVRIWYAPFTV